MTDQRYAGFENLNSYRNYPFSETANLNDVQGVPFAVDIFVDAFLYPVVASPTRVLLTLVDFSRGGYVEISLEGLKETISGSFDGSAVELYDSLGRHAGTLSCGPGWQRELPTGRVRMFDGAEFAPSVLSPIPYDGVVSLSFDEARTTRKHIELVGDGCITPVLEEKPYGPELHFDVQDDYVPDTSPVVRQVLFAAIGRTLFDITDQSEDTVLATTPLLDREDVCWQAHQEDAVSAIVDTCADESNDVCPAEEPPFKIQEIWKCPSAVGDLNLVAEDIVGLKNSLHIVPVEGFTKSNSPQISEGMSPDAMYKEASKLLTRPTQVGNGIRISIPGLQNGR